jgi:hypothetical protein
MKEIVQGKCISPRMLFAFFALLTLFARPAHAQGKQAVRQDKSSAPEQCSDHQLSLRNTGEVVSMGPMRFMEFIFTNTSSSPCTLSGYPRFQFLNKYGRPLPGGLAANGETFQSLYSLPPQLVVTMVTIEPGKKAKFLINYLARYDEEREKPCRTYPIARITVPGIKRVFVQRFRKYGIEVCSGLEVSPVFPASIYD